MTEKEQMSLLDVMGVAAGATSSQSRKSTGAAKVADDAPRDQAQAPDQAPDQTPVAEAATVAAAPARKKTPAPRKTAGHRDETHGADMTASSTADADLDPGPETAAEQEPLDPAPSDLACAPVSGLSRSVALDQFLCFSLYSANHAMTRVYRPLLQSLGLTYPQYLAMVVLWEKNDQLVGDIGARLHLESNTMTPLLKRLESLGLVSRERSQKDERQVRVKLTRKGHALKQKTNDFASCILAASGISVDALIDLQQRISELRDNLLESQSPDRG